MRIPRAENAIIDDPKLLNYLLSPTHPIGRFKSAFFARIGFNRSNAQDLKLELMRIIRSNEIVESSKTQYGLKYRVDGELRGPNKRAATVVTVWISATELEPPRFITAYPRD